MKQKILLAAAVLTLLMLSACGGNAAQASTEPASPTQAVSQPTQPPAPSATLAIVESATPTQELSTATAEPVTETTTVEQNTSGGVSFAKDVMPIFQNYCLRCHGQEDVKEGLDMTTYDGLMAGSFNGSVVEPGDANNSYLVQLIAEGKMPKRGQRPSQQELQTIIDWIDQGALNN